MAVVDSKLGPLGASEILPCNSNPSVIFSLKYAKDQKKLESLLEKSKGYLLSTVL